MSVDSGGEAMDEERRDPLCQQCGKPFVRRSHRRGLLEHGLSLLYVYPFRCQLCTGRFLAFQWGARFVRYQPDQREYVRLPVRYPVTFAGDWRGDGVTVNLSMRGCGIETDLLPSPGGVLHLTFPKTNGQPAIEVEAAVTRSVLPRLRQVGVEFLRVRVDDQERLRRVIEAHLRGLPRCDLQPSPPSR